MAPTISVIMDRAAGPYADPTVAAIQHAADHVGRSVSVHVVPTAQLTDDRIDALTAGVILGPGTPYDHPDRAELVVRSARERGLPLVGT